MNISPEISLFLEHPGAEIITLNKIIRW